MDCPFCGNPKTNVVFTGKPEDGKLQRRRYCPACKKRFNTFERPFLGTPMVVKSDGKREVFDSEKLSHGIRIACAKRPVPAEKISELVESIEKRLQMEGKYEIPSRMIGDLVIQGLKSLDLIAYIRYAIVYLRMDDLHVLRSEIDSLLGENDSKAN